MTSVDASTRQQDVNPYAPPPAEPAPRRPIVRGGLSIRFYLYVVAVVTAFLLHVRLIGGPNSGVSSVLHFFAITASIVIRLGWLQRQWERLPSRRQVVRGRPISGRQATWRNLIPIYGSYWAFVVHTSLCDAINAMLAKKGRPRTAPARLSVLAPGASLLSTLYNLRFYFEGTTGGAATTSAPAAEIVIVSGVSVLWALFMLGVERSFARARAKSRKDGEMSSKVEGLS